MPLKGALIDEIYKNYIFLKIKNEKHQDFFFGTADRKSWCFFVVLA